ncbi:MAG: DUF177 domain-containing protein [Alistipes sp.]|jgi:uncharacterized metal-binding protein YceD (DUF177 family)|nr:DUF177 domain-containing protein [Alistipes sp.]
MKPRYTIPYKGLKEGTHEFEWHVGESFWAAHPEGGVKGGDATVRAVLERSGAMRLTIEIEGVVVVACDRCLEDCELPVNYRGRLAVKASEEEHPFEGDILWVHPREALIDVEQYIYESIVLSLPLQRVHPEDVHGRPLCNPAMLERFKIVTEEEFEDLTTK